MMETVAIIPAKGFSRRCHNKNIREHNGIPIFLKSAYYAIREGIMPLVVSENEDILRTARREGLPCFKESKHEDFRMEYLIDEVLSEHNKIKKFCLLQPSSPIRKQGLLKKMMNEIGEYGNFTVQKIKLVGLLGEKIYRNDLSEETEKYFYFHDGNIICRNVEDYRKERFLLTEKMSIVENEFPYNLQIDNEREFNILSLIAENEKIGL